MRIAVQGCSHGCLSQIYDSIAQYEAQKSTKIDLLLLCGDFQALRSEHDFASLAVPPKYHHLGTFHEYYSGKRVAPVLTLVIGGNHEASNYMWEMYWGGWLAPNIYYLGEAGCVRFGDLRIVGASGIYKEHDYNKGHFERVPYTPSTMRSIYHIRKYAIDRLKLLPREPRTIALSHDWPTTIPLHGDTKDLLRRKPYFADEVKTNTLGSPPLLELLKELQPDYWFSAHLHVKFAAVYTHGSCTTGGKRPSAESSRLSATHLLEETKATQVKAINPDEINIEDDDFDDTPAQPESATSQPPKMDLLHTVDNVVSMPNPDEIEIEDDFNEEPAPVAADENGAVNPDEITIDDFDDTDEMTAVSTAQPTEKDRVDGSHGHTEGGHPDGVQDIKEALKIDESADLVEAARKEGVPEAATGVIGTAEPVVDTAVSSKATGETEFEMTKFLALDKCGPGKDFIQYLDIPTSDLSDAGPPCLTFDPYWIAITRLLYPYLSLEIASRMLPPREQLDQLIQAEYEKIKAEGLLVPKKVDGQDVRVEGPPAELVWDKGDIEIDRVQKFWPTAPAQGMPGGSPNAWYTNPQTEALCGMLGVENVINPAPI